MQNSSIQCKTVQCNTIQWNIKHSICSKKLDFCELKTFEMRQGSILRSRQLSSSVEVDMYQSGVETGVSLKVKFSLSGSQNTIHI